MSAGELPDPLDFAARALAARGALVEAAAGQVEALLPTELARALGLPEELTLAAAATEGGGVSCGIGAPLLEALSAGARTGVPWTVMALAVDAPKVSQATSLAGRAGDSQRAARRARRGRARGPVPPRGGGLVGGGRRPLRGILRGHRGA